MKAIGFHNQITYTCVCTFANTDTYITNTNTYITNTNANSALSGTLGQNKDLRGFHGHSYIRSDIDLTGKMHPLEAFPALHSPGLHAIPVLGSSNPGGSTSAEASSWIACSQCHCHESPAVPVTVSLTHIHSNKPLLPSDLTHLA